MTSALKAARIEYIFVAVQATDPSVAASMIGRVVDAAGEAE
jgi:hypothetical protein